MGEEKNAYESNLNRRFIKWVLLPPFLALLVLGLVGLLRLNDIVRKQAVSDISRSASTTAAALDRELTLRETVLKQTGDSLLVIQNQYKDARLKLDDDRAKCRTFIAGRSDFRNSPGGVCNRFAGAFANHGVSLATLEDEYVSAANQQNSEQSQRSNDRLTAYKQIFPETLAIIVSDSNNATINTALSGVLKGSTAPFAADTKTALQTPIYGKQLELEGYNSTVFAFPIAGGSVLAAYDLYHPNYLRQVWDNAPIDRKHAIAVVLDGENAVAYPNVPGGNALTDNAAKLRTGKATTIKIDKVDHTVVAVNAGKSNWMVAVASPTAAVLSASRDAQFISILVMGLFLLGFVWVGSFFVQRILGNIVRLIGGAMIFSTGRLDYKIVLDHADSEFVRLADTMNHMAQRIAAAERRIEEKNKEFISIATHEIRSPLTAIIGHLSVLKTLPINKSEKGHVDEAYYGTVQLRDLINDMLNVARLEGGKSGQFIETVEMKSIVGEVVNNMGIVAEMKGIKLRYDPELAAQVNADANRLRIVMNNFVSNAIKYNRKGGQVSVYHELKDNQLVTAIKDNGLGIPKEQQKNMFEKFFRVKHEDRSSITGTGLGMYVVRQFVEQMGGRVWFESVHEEGTTFYFSLPIVTGTTSNFKNKLNKAIKTVASRNRNKKIVQSYRERLNNYKPDNKK